MAKDLNVFDKEYGLLINGEWTKGSEGKLLSSYNPANGDELAKFTDATDADVDAAVAAAQEAFKTWRKTTTAERAAILNKIADVIDENAELFALQETLDNGKPIRETRAADIPLASDHFRYFASVIRGEEGTATQLDAEDLSIVLREPIGVVGQIIPWNFPFLMAAWKIAPALAAGCTIVIHPSSSTSLSLLSLAQKINHLLPKGVLNVITGRGSKSGEYMLHHKGFNKLAFTGSTEVGRRVGIAAAELLIPSTLELGGKSANIFFDDMPFDKALEGAQKGILFNQGQVCCAGSRIFVQEGIYDKFVNALETRRQRLMSVLHTAPPKPYSLSLAILMTSSSVLNLITVAIGPKISSWATRASLLLASIKVGSTNSPLPNSPSIFLPPVMMRQPSCSPILTYFKMVSS